MSHFGGFGYILVIYEVFGYFGHLQVSRGILGGFIKFLNIKKIINFKIIV